MTTATLLATLAVLALAGLAHGIFGIGYAMIATPLLALFLDYRSAVFLSAVPLLLMAAAWLLTHRAAWRGSLLPKRLLPGIAVGAVVGVALQVSLPEQVSLLLLAALLAGSVFIPALLKRWPRPAQERPGRAPLYGALAGVTESALNVGAPFMVLYGGLARLARIEQLLALNLCFCLGKCIQVGLMAVELPPTATPLAIVSGCLGSLAAYAIGDRLAGRFSEETFRRLLRNFLMAMVAALLFRAATI